MKRNPRTLGFQCPPQLRERIENAADHEGQTISAFLRNACLREIERISAQKRLDFADYLEKTEGLGRFL